MTTDRLSRFDVGAAFHIWHHGAVWAGGCKGHLELLRVSKHLQFNLWTQLLQNCTRISECGRAVVSTPQSRSKNHTETQKGLGLSGEQRFPPRWPLACWKPRGDSWIQVCWMIQPHLRTEWQLSSAGRLCDWQMNRLASNTALIVCFLKACNYTVSSLLLRRKKTGGDLQDTPVWSGIKARQLTDSEHKNCCSVGSTLNKGIRLSRSHTGLCKIWVPWLPVHKRTNTGCPLRLVGKSNYTKQKYFRLFYFTDVDRAAENDRRRMRDGRRACEERKVSQKQTAIKRQRQAEACRPTCWFKAACGWREGSREQDRLVPDNWINAAFSILVCPIFYSWHQDRNSILCSFSRTTTEATCITRWSG